MKVQLKRVKESNFRLSIRYNYCFDFMAVNKGKDLEEGPHKAHRDYWQTGKGL